MVLGYSRVIGRFVKATRDVTGRMARFGAPFMARTHAATTTMNALDHRQAVASGSSRSPENRLDSWKSIATYLGRGVRTVQRWEREEGLPVHRLAHEKRGSVYADRQEVDAWWESRRRTLSNAPVVDTAEPPSSPAIERLTWMSAATFWPALSSDGRLLAYVSDGGRDGTSPQIWLQQIGGSPVCLTSGPCDRSLLSFSADDTRLVFTGNDEAGQNVYAMPTLGGEARLLKRAARAGRFSPDGKWLAYVALDDSAGVRIAAVDGTSDRTIGPDLMDVSFAIWSPDSKYVLVQAHPDPSVETDYWLIATDGSGTTTTGILQRCRQQGALPLNLPVAWVGDAVVFSIITPKGVGLFRQRLAPGTAEPIGEAERLTHGTEFDSFVTGGCGRVAYVSTHQDQNLWSVAIDPVSGVARGALRRLTRGPGIVSCLSVSHESRMLAYFSARPTGIGVILRSLTNDSATEFALEPRIVYGFPAISPSGGQLAFGTVAHGPRVMRPIFVASLPDGPRRELGEDCGGRPRGWVGERFVVVERYGGRLHSVGLIDTVTGDHRDLLTSAELSISNARVSSDSRWIAFDAARPGGPPTVFVAPLGDGPVSEDRWIPVDRRASHPFWSADGSLLYYLPPTPTSELRNVVRARRFDTATGTPLGDAFTVFTTTEMVIPAMISASAPVATPDQIIFVFGDFRGDVWMMETQ